MTIQKFSSALFITLLAASLTLGLSAQATSGKDDTKVAVKASLEQEAKVNFDNKDPLFPATVDVSAFLSGRASASSTAQARMQKMIETDTKLINDRLAALAGLRASVNASASLTVGQKASLTAAIDSNVSGLNTLLAKIKADPDEATLKADSQKIYTDFRIYGVLIPKIKALIALNSQGNHVSAVNEVLIAVQAKINDFAAGGVDMSKNQVAIDAAKANLVQANAKITVMTDQANNLKPSDYPTASALVFNQLKAGIKDIRNFFIQINTNLKAAIRL